ncbi:PulJ/GspJ family protein [Desulforhopalus sp. 52FAK]
MPSSYSNTKGFTLIELLLAIFIFAIVIASVYGAYRSTFHIIQGSEATLNESHKARAALERITEDITAIVTGPGGYLVGTERDIAGSRGDSMTFISSTHISLGRKDVIKGDAVISYTSEIDESDNSMRLLRSDAVKKPGATVEGTNGTEYLLCSGLQEIRFTYFNDEGEETTNWETESTIESDGTVTGPELPAMVSIELVFKGSGTEESGNHFKTAVAFAKKLEE